ncbi:MAG: ABC1 kinase family protein [Gemmatimonadales bacterium]
MTLSLSHLPRYKEIAVLLWKYGRSDLVQQLGMDEAFAPEEERAVASTGTAPDELAADLEAMGPTYVKLGQVLSSRSDLLPAPYRTALARLQDDVEPFPYADVERLVEEELGVRISKGFARFDPEPVAAASLGQVHSAVLRNGRPVVVKVQRPEIGPRIAEDFEVMEQVAEFLDARTEIGRRHRFVDILAEFRRTIRQELDYEREAQHLVTLGENLTDFPLIQVPQPVPDYCSRRVLTMDLVRGEKITSLGPLARLEIDGTPLLDELFRAYLKQVLVDGFFHADPHPGNVFLTEDGRIALLDLGMVGYVTPSMQEQLLKLLAAISEGKSDDAAEVLIAMSEAREEFNPASFRRGVGQLMMSRTHQTLKDASTGRALLGLAERAGADGLLVPGELTLLGKTLLQLDEIGLILDPAFDAQAAIRQEVSNLATRRMSRELSPGRLLSSFLEMKELMTGLPSRLHRILEALSNRDLEVKIKAVDAPLVMEGLEKIANRITAGIILAALILGAALLMRVDTAFRIVGYPGLAMLFFLAAVAGGAWLVIRIVVQDHRRERR